MCGSNPRTFRSGEGESEKVFTYFFVARPVHPVLTNLSLLSFSSAALLGVTCGLGYHWYWGGGRTLWVGGIRHRFRGLSGVDCFHDRLGCRPCRASGGQGCDFRWVFLFCVLSLGHGGGSEKSERPFPTGPYGFLYPSVASGAEQFFSNFPRDY